MLDGAQQGCQVPCPSGACRQMLTSRRSTNPSARQLGGVLLHYGLSGHKSAASTARVRRARSCCMQHLQAHTVPDLEIVTSCVHCETFANQRNPPLDLSCIWANHRSRSLSNGLKVGHSSWMTMQMLH